MVEFSFLYQYINHISAIKVTIPPAMYETVCGIDNPSGAIII